MNWSRGSKAILRRLGDFVCSVKLEKPSRHRRPTVCQMILRLAFSLPRTELLDAWGIVRGDAAALRGVEPAIVRGRRAGRLGIELLVSDARQAARTAGPSAVVDRPTLEDIMVLMAGEAGHAA